MTRLVTSDIDQIPDSWEAYEKDLRLKTGCSLIELACDAVGSPLRQLNAILPGIRAGIVPVTWGEGLIAGFTAAVASILSHIGLATLITENADIAGIEEAVAEKCDLIFISDDEDFSVLNLNQKKTVHNSVATGKGFAAALDLMAGGAGGREALVLGCGPVGASAAYELDRRGVRVSLYDADKDRCRRLIENPATSMTGNFRMAQDLEESLQRFDCIIEATPAGDLIDAAMIGPQTFVSAPGMPLGLTDAAIHKIGLRLVHDPLQIGVATMAIGALSAKIA